MGFNLFGKKEKSITELQDENERKEIELSVAQKEALMAKLRADSLSVKKDFGGSLRAAYSWFKTH